MTAWEEKQSQASVAQFVNNQKNFTPHDIMVFRMTAPILTRYRITVFGVEYPVIFR